MELPGESRDVAVDGVRARYVAAGEGPPVVLLHGLTSSKAVWWNNIGPLSERHRVYALDLPGHGDSEKPNISYDARSMIEFLRGFLNAVGHERAALIGGSLGGGLALHTALAYPDMVSKLALCGSGALGREVALAIRLASLPWLGELLVGEPLGGPRVMLRKILYDKSLARGALLEELRRTNRMRGAREAALKIIRNYIRPWGVRRKYIVTGRLRGLETPTMIFWGADDEIIPVSHAYRAAKALPRCELHVFGSCGHWPYVERADDFNRLTLEFLSR